MEIFVVYLVTYSGDKLPKYYIGSTTKNKIDKGYMGSVRSKKWKKIFQEEIKNNRHLFDIEILSTHKTRKEALSEELRLQKEKDVVKSKDYFNESFACVNGFFGMEISYEHKKMLSKLASENYSKGKAYRLPPLPGTSNPMFGKKNEVIAINTLTKEKIRVDRKEFDSNTNLVGHTSGFLSVIDRTTGQKIRIAKKDFEIDRSKYKHPNEDRKHNDLLKNKLSEMRKGFTTVKDWEGNFHRVHKEDDRVKNGIFGGATSFRWVITDLEGNEYKTFNFRKFFNVNGLQRPAPKNICEDGIIKFKKKPFKLKSTDGWKVRCLDKEK